MSLYKLYYKNTENKMKYKLEASFVSPSEKAKKSRLSVRLPRAVNCRSFSLHKILLPFIFMRDKKIILIK
jgi:hypothetical protein